MTPAMIGPTPRGGGTVGREGVGVTGGLGSGLLPSRLNRGDWERAAFGSTGEAGIVSTRFVGVAWPRFALAELNKG